MGNWPPMWRWPYTQRGKVQSSTRPSFRDQKGGRALGPRLRAAATRGAGIPAWSPQGLVSPWPDRRGRGETSGSDRGDVPGIRRIRFSACVPASHPMPARRVGRGNAVPQVPIPARIGTLHVAYIEVTCWSPWIRRSADWGKAKMSAGPKRQRKSVIRARHPADVMSVVRTF